MFVFAAAPLSAACGTDASPTLLPETAKCPALDGADRYSPITLAPGVDGIAFAQVESRYNAMATVGTICKTAKDTAGCSNKVKALLADAQGVTGWSFRNNGVPESPEFGVATRGDEVMLLGTLDELVAVIAPIDTPQEAMMLLVFHGTTPSCSTGNLRTDPDGFTIRSTLDGCSGPEWEYQYKVTSAGTVSQTENKKLRDHDSSCSQGT